MLRLVRIENGLVSKTQRTLPVDVSKKHTFCVSRKKKSHVSNLWSGHGVYGGHLPHIYLDDAQDFSKIDEK